MLPTVPSYWLQGWKVALLQAPMTAQKTRIKARQAMEAIRFMKALLDEPALLQKIMTDLSDSEHIAIRDEFESKGRS